MRFFSYTTFVWNILVELSEISQVHSTHAFMWTARYYCQILLEVGVFWTGFQKQKILKFH